MYIYSIYTHFTTHFYPNLSHSFDAPYLPRPCRHLVNLTTGGAPSQSGVDSKEPQQAWSLDTWVYVEPPVAVFQSVYRFLDDEWAKIPAPIKVQLKGKHPPILQSSPGRIVKPCRPCLHTPSCSPITASHLLCDWTPTHHPPLFLIRCGQTFPVSPWPTVWSRPRASTSASPRTCRPSCSRCHVPLGPTISSSRSSAPSRAPASG